MGILLLYIDRCQDMGMTTSVALEIGTGAARAVACCPPLSRTALDVESATTAAAMFKALGDPVRLRIFSVIAASPDGELCVCDLPDVGVSQPTVSHHLKKLRTAGLLTSRKEGTWVHYRVSPEVLSAMSALLRPTA